MNLHVQAWNTTETKTLHTSENVRRLHMAYSAKSWVAPCAIWLVDLPQSMFAHAADEGMFDLRMPSHFKLVLHCVEGLLGLACTLHSDISISKRL